jgi:hypothetical protein
VKERFVPKVTGSARDLELWIEARIAEGANRFTVHAEDSAYGTAEAQPCGKEWRVGPDFKASQVARFVQMLADGFLALTGRTRGHYELHAHRGTGRRVRRYACVVVYGRDRQAAGGEHCEHCAAATAQIRQLEAALALERAAADKLHRSWMESSEATHRGWMELLGQLRSDLSEADARLADADARMLDLLRASEAARRAVPWTFGPRPRPLRHDN